MKTIKVEIAMQDLEVLKQSGYNLCFAKSVNNEFNVVWKAYSKYSTMNQFSYESQYELFGTNAFVDGMEITPSTNTQSCDLGNSCTLNQSGILEPQVPGGAANNLTFVNDYGSIHPGINQLCTGIDGSKTISPIYVSKKSIVQGQTFLAPLDIVLVWFQQDIESNTMDSSLNEFETNSRFITLYLTQTNEVKCLYEDGEWRIVNI